MGGEMDHPKNMEGDELWTFVEGCTIISHKICEDAQNGGQNFFEKNWCAVRAKIPYFTRGIEHHNDSKSKNKKTRSRDEANQ